MQLLTLDPRLLKANPANPRQIMAGDHADSQLIANIKALGILQPPVARQEGDDFIIVAGHRRVQAAIALDLPEILVLIRDAGMETESALAVSENVVRSPLNPVDQWRAIEALSSDHWTDEAIAAALALPLRTIKKLRLLAQLHPAMLDTIANGDMPPESQLRIIAAAGAKEQASVWKKLKPRKGEPSVAWFEVARALEKRRLPANAAKFGEDEAQAFGILWEDDLFAPAGEDARTTTNVEGFLAAQAAWMEANLPKNGVILPIDEYGRPKLPPKVERVWGTARKSDTIGHYVDPHDGSIHEIIFRPTKPNPKKGPQADSEESNGAPSALAKTRPAISQKGMAIIGDLRTDAFARAPFDDSTLLGLLLLAFNANNVDIKTSDFTRDKRQRLFQAITEGGHLTQSIELLRKSARELLAQIFSCRPGYTSSGLAARFAGDAIDADVHLPNMATEEFLSCLSKPAIEAAAKSLGVVLGQRARDTRAAIIKETAGTAFVLPAARFAPDEHELAAHQELIRSWDGDHEEEADNGEADNSDGELHASFGAAMAKRTPSPNSRDNACSIKIQELAVRLVS
ncbi:MAG TPA: ParB/RepB/Spo0J family partition protein [Methylocella sp.]|nr:ParB/RepB/Spo0J family partition protein [Methylocella sp.]